MKFRQKKYALQLNILLSGLNSLDCSCLGYFLSFIHQSLLGFLEYIWIRGKHQIHLEQTDSTRTLAVVVNKAVKRKDYKVLLPCLGSSLDTTVHFGRIHYRSILEKVRRTYPLHFAKLLWCRQGWPSCWVGRNKEQREAHRALGLSTNATHDPHEQSNNWCRICKHH